MENERQVVGNFGFFKGSQQITSTANPVAVVDTQPVPAGIFWHVERASLQCLFISAVAPASGDLMGLYLCPPGTPSATQNTNGGSPQGAKQISDEPIIIEEMDASATLPPPNGVVIALGGASTAWLINMRALREFYVPSQWFVRAVVNLAGNAGGPDPATTLYMSLQYAQLNNC